MILRNSMKQIMRTPVRSVLFVVLLVFSTILVAVGGNLQVISNTNMERLEHSFQTIGVVEQRKSAVVQKKEWDAERNEYVYLNKAEYDISVPLSVLDLEGVEYIQEPEKRPYYEALLPNYKIWSESGGKQSAFIAPIIVEVETEEDCVPDYPVRLKVNKVIYSDGNFQGKELYFCDHYNEHPDPLYQGKRYIMCLSSRPAHQEYQNMGMYYEYIPGWSVNGIQYTKDGARVGEESEDAFCEEINEDFYDSGQWKKWENLCTHLERVFQTVPVTPTHSTNLLLSFYNGESYIQDGKDISTEEYERGECVCLVSSEFAKNNELEVGDKITLPLITANYKNSPGVSEIYFNTSLNAQRELYSAFSENEYRIAGIYGVSPSASLSSGYQMGNCEIIVPWNSIKESDENNIVAVGPMMGYTTSFEIPNGTMEQFMEAWTKQDVGNVQITFYDKGYTQVKSSIDQVQKMSVILLTVGSIMIILILLFYGHLFISRQHRRIAIERSMGLNKKQCVASVASGILLIAVVGSLAGNIIGNVFSEKLVRMSVEEEFYDTIYSSSELISQGEDDADIDYSVNGMWVFIIVEVGIVGLTCIITGTELSYLLKKEPLELLGKNE